ncbi:MAG: hypothetical protein GW913_05690 [Myxococcales bacterium]|nr:hypothetical protein [Myxococcales bacterium]
MPEAGDPDRALRASPRKLIAIALAIGLLLIVAASVRRARQRAEVRRHETTQTSFQDGGQ